MRWLLFVLAGALGLAAGSAHAACVVPFIFQNNVQLIDAVQVNANFAAVAGCVNTPIITITGAVQGSGPANAVVTTGPVNLTTTALTESLPNSGAGTVLNQLVIYDVGYTFKAALTSSTTNVVGICQTACGITGNATVAISGTALCAFDGATTAADFVVASTTVAGQCHDAGATVPTSVQVLGQVNSTNGSGGTFGVNMGLVGVAGGSSGSPISITGVASGTGITAITLVGPVNLGATALTQSVPNSATGTATNKLVIYDTGFTFKTALTTSTTNVAGICQSDCATTGNAVISIGGIASCVFDGATTAGDFVITSTSAAGDCHDAGATLPAGVQTLGQVTSTNGGGGTYQLNMNRLSIPLASDIPLTNTHLLVGNASNIGTDVAASGDLTLTNTGAFTIANNAVTTVKINAAAVTYAKIQNVATVSLLGNPTGSPASASEITLGSGLAFSGSTLTASGSGGTVTSITCNAGLTGGTITTTGTCALDVTHANTWTGDQTFGNGHLKLSGSSSGTSILEAPATGGGTVTLMAGSDTVAGLGTAQSFTAANNFAEVHGTTETVSLSSNNYNAVVADCGKVKLLPTGTTPTVTLPNINPTSGSCTITFVTTAAKSYLFNVAAGGSKQNSQGFYNTRGTAAGDTVSVILVTPSVSAAAWNVSGDVTS